MTVEVFLMADVKDLGAEGDVVSVANGYARNFLLPKELAAPVTEATKRRLVKIQEKREETRKETLDSARKFAAKLEKVSCTMPVKVGEDDKLFGSVTMADVAKALSDQGFDIDKKDLLMDGPIRELGVFDVKVRVHPDVDVAVKVWVVEE